MNNQDDRIDSIQEKFRKITYSDLSKMDVNSPKWKELKKELHEIIQADNKNINNMIIKNY